MECVSLSDTFFTPFYSYIDVLLTPSFPSWSLSHVSMTYLVPGVKSQCPSEGENTTGTQVKRVCLEVVVQFKNICTEQFGYVEKQLCSTLDKPHM